MPKLLSGQILRDGGSGQFITLPGAQPALGPSPSTGTGFTLITDAAGVTSYSNILGNIVFSNGTLTNYVTNQDFQVGTSGTGTFKIHAPTQFLNSVLFANSLTFVDLLASGLVRFNSGVNSTASNNGTLVVDGGVGITKDVFIDGILDVQDGLNVHGTVELSPAGYSVTISPSSGGLLTISPSAIGSINNLTVGALTPQSGKFTTLEASGDTLITSLTSSTSTATGALVVRGGVGVGADLNASRIFDNANRVISQAYVGPGLSISTNTGPVVTLTNTGVLSLIAGTGTFVSNTTGNVTIWTYGNTFQQVTEQGNTTTLPVYFNNTINATATNTGSIIIAGGVGIAKDIFIGGNIYANNLNPSQIYAYTATFTSTQITGLAGNTTTLSSNALYVAGGTGVQGNLTVGGSGFFYGNLTVFGTLTTVVSSVADIGRKVLALSTSAGPSILAIDSGITVGPISSPFVKFLFDGVNNWKSTGNVIPSTNGGYDLGTSANNWNDLFVQFARVTDGTNATNTTSGALTVVGGAGIGRNLYVGGQARILNDIDSSSTSTGALTVVGGIGVGGSAYVGNILRVFGTSNSTSTQTGALIVSGGAGFATDVYARNFFDAGGNRVLTTSSIAEFGVTRIIGGTDTAVSTATGQLVIWNTSTLQTVTSRGSTTTVAITINNGTNATNSATGALIVAGGVGIAKDLFVGGNAIIYGNATFNGTVTNVFSTNTVYTDNVIELHKPTTGTWSVNDGKDIGLKFSFYSTVSTSAFLGRANDTGYLEWYGTGVETNGSTFSGTYGVFKTGIVNLVGGVESSSTATGTLIVSGGAGVGGNLYAKAVYSNGSPVLTAASLAGFGISYITAGTDTAISTSTGDVRIWNTSTLQTVVSRGNTSNIAINITSTASSTSTNTGALVVAGGLGIGADVWVQGIIHAAAIDAASLSSSVDATFVNVNATGRIITTTDLDYPIQINSDADTTSTFYSINANSGTNASAGLVIENNVNNRVELILSSSNRSFNGFGTGTAYLFLSDNIDKFGIGNNAELNFYTQGAGNLVQPALQLGTTGTITVTDTIRIVSNQSSPVPTSNLSLESNAVAGSVGITLKNTSINGQSYTLDVGGNNRSGQGGSAINEGNFTLKDNAGTGTYRLVVTKNTGNLLVGFDTDYNNNKLQVNGSAYFSKSVIATTGTFQDLNISGTSTIYAELTVINNFIAENTSTFKGPTTFEITATFNKSVIIGSSIQQTIATPINTTNPTSIDSYNASLYRSSRSLVQITEGSVFHLVEVVLLHDDSGTVYKSEYGILSTGDQLGDFSASIVSGQVVLYFTAYTSTAKNINVVRTAIGV